MADCNYGELAKSESFYGSTVVQGGGEAGRTFVLPTRADRMKQNREKHMSRVGKATKSSPHFAKRNYRGWVRGCWGGVGEMWGRGSGGGDE